jgi:hypothetical protein
MEHAGELRLIGNSHEHCGVDIVTAGVHDIDFFA